MNREDLKGYKKGDAQVFAMIPGIQNLNTVGASPLKRGAKNILDAGYYTSRQTAEGAKHPLSQSVKVLPGLSSELKEELARKKEEVLPDKYNPITNPIPWYGQNPYISKERKRITALHY